jgi:peptidoglycan/LPS O-acetylase OafA/YrhL
MTNTSIRAETAVGRVRHLLSAVWGTIAGIAPHVLHHVGPLAGAAILAGTGGRVLFFLLGLALAIPMLVRLYRRFRSWVAPAIAVAVFAVTYSLSSIFLGPLISGAADSSAPETPAATTTTDEHGHTTSP